MAEPKNIFDIFWPWVYEGIERKNGEAIFHNTETGLYITKPRLMEVWKDDVLVLPEEPMYDKEGNVLNPDPHLFKPGDRLIFPKQRQFMRLLDDYDFLSFGGAGGVGKSLMLEMSHVWKQLSWKQQGITEVKTGMFCETYPDLYDRQISKIPEWIPEYLGEWYEQKKIFRFRKKYGGGEELYRTTENTMRLRSIEFGHCTVDEASQNPEIILDEISARLRSPKVPNPSFGLATNPGGIGTNWYKKKLVDPETRLKPEYSERFGRWTRGAFHIQSLPTENPLLGPDYYVNLERKAPHVRDALLYGKWDSYEGLAFDMLTPRLHRITPFKIPDDTSKWRFIDVGTSHPFVCEWFSLFAPTLDYKRGRLVGYREYSVLEKHASAFKRNVWKLEHLSNGGTAKEFDEMVRTKDWSNLKFDRNVINTILSFDAWHFKGSTMGDKTIAERFNTNDEYGPSLNCIPGPQHDRVGGARLLSELFSYRSEEYTIEDDPIPENNGKRAMRIVEPPFIFFFNTMKLTWNSLTSMIHDKNNPEDVAKTIKRIYYPGEGDDEFTALRDGVMTINLDDFLPDNYDDPQFNDINRTPDYYDQKELQAQAGYASF